MTLSTPEWKTIPWLETPKNQKDELLDILLDMPGLLEELDKISCCADRAEKERLQQDLVAKCWLYDTQLRAWLATVCPSSDACPQVYRRPDMDRITYEDIALTEALQTFWITCLLLYSTLRFVSDPQTTFPEHIDPQLYVYNIVSTTPILLTPSSGIYGQNLMILPFALALQYAESTAELQEMVSNVIEGPQGELVKGFLLRVDLPQHMCR